MYTLKKLQPFWEYSFKMPNQTIHINKIWANVQLFHTVHWSKLQCSDVQCSDLYHIVLLCSEVQCSAVQKRKVQRSTVKLLVIFTDPYTLFLFIPTLRFGLPKKAPYPPFTNPRVPLRFLKSSSSTPSTCSSSSSTSSYPLSTSSSSVCSVCSNYLFVKWPRLYRF